MLELDGISRTFTGRRVLDDVGFTVRRGRLTGFVGGNGAGKTTTMRILLGVLTPDSGTVTLDGRPLGPERRSGFGYMPEERGLYPKMTVIDQITYLARLHGFDRRDAAARARDLLERLGLGERLTDPVDDLSLGNQQRAQIAAALVHDPDVLVLDEPFSGLDPMAVDVVLEVLREHARRGAPVLFSSHQLDVVERLCDDVVVIAGGRIRAAGDKEDLRAQFSESRYEIASAEPLTWLDAEAGVRVVVRDDGHAMFDADEATAQRVLRLALGTAPVTRFAPVQPRLAEIFRDIVTDAPADTPTTDTRPKETVR